MASVTSLGLHQPTGLQYAIQERLLPSDPPSSSYTWQTHVDTDPNSPFDDDELLVTPRCVIWSQGGIFRKCYKFDLEKEPVTQALFTTFPSVGPLAVKNRKSPTQDGTNTRSAAIVVFLKTQAHIYFVSGTSHVIHLPFEVESAVAAPNGMVLQRKLRVDNLVPASLKFPKVPPNSFVSSQPQPWSAASSQQSTFSIADLGAPQQMPVPPNSTLKDLWDPPALKNDSNWPRLFCLSDPLSEMGLVVAQMGRSESRGRRRSSGRVTLDTAEEILHVFSGSEAFSRENGDPLVIALTLNRETSLYHVWKLSYVDHEVGGRDKQRVHSNHGTRRRSSFIHGAGTGATTPIAGSQQTIRESVGGNSITAKQDGESRDQIVDFVSTLDPDFENPALPRRTSRRVSSMLARADLSASHERSAFNDLASAHQHTSTRRGESMGSQYGRTSTGTFGTVNGQNSNPAQFNISINSYLDAPVDDLLDELRGGGDFEGFHNMGLDDDEFDALRQEIILTKIGSVPAEHSNVRYSSQHIPAKSQSRIFTLTAPTAADGQADTIVTCILDPDEKRLVIIPLLIRSHKAAYKKRTDVNSTDAKAEKETVDISIGSPRKANHVIDACRIDDGRVSRILVLTETPDGYGEVTLQAPWSILMKVSLPGKFTISNIRNLSHDATPRAKREGGFKRVLSQGPRALRGLRNSKLRGLVDLVDDEGKMHQLQLLLQPRNPHVSQVIDVCRAVLSSTGAGEGVLVTWWHVMQWLRLESTDATDMEWTALIITLFSLALGMSSTSKATPSRVHTKRKPRSSFLRSSSGTHLDLEDWETMQNQETSNGNPCPPWAQNRGWKWIGEEESDALANDEDSQTTIFTTDATGTSNFIQEHSNLTREFLASTSGQAVLSGCLPTSKNRDSEIRESALVDIFVALHLLREEQKLDTMTSDSFSTGAASLTSVLAQIARWLGWESWIHVYDLEEASAQSINYDSASPIDYPLLEPFACPSIYDWMQMCLTTRSLVPFMTLPGLVTARSGKTPRHRDELARLTPRTLLFSRFFSMMRDDWSSADFVEALSAAGMDSLLLETLPEAILAPLREAIVQCQTEPPTTWSKTLLAIVGREDVNMLLTPGARPRQFHSSSLLVSICHSLNFLILTDPRPHLTSHLLIYILSVQLPMILSLQYRLMVLRR
jgi:anaphase-promoting complex subunit 1